MENSECCVGEDVSLTPVATDEFTADIKQEPEDLFEVHGQSVVNVSFFVCFSLS